MKAKKNKHPLFKEISGWKVNTPLFFLQFSGRTLSHEKYPFTGHFGNTHGVRPFSEGGGGGGHKVQSQSSTFGLMAKPFFRSHLKRWSPGPRPKKSCEWPKTIASPVINRKFAVPYLLCTYLRLLSIANKLRLISTLYKTGPRCATCAIHSQATKEPLMTSVLWKGYTVKK